MCMHPHLGGHSDELTKRHHSGLQTYLEVSEGTTHQHPADPITIDNIEVLRKLAWWWQVETDVQGPQTTATT